MSKLYTDEYANLYRELLASVKGMEEDGATAYHMCCYGETYADNPEKRFMVIGRDVNGWNGNMDRDVEDEMSDARDSISPYDLKFIDTYGSKSPFWCMTKGVVDELGLAGAECDDWYANLAWNNLYKVAKKEENKGQPKEKVFTAQFSACNKILKYEISKLQPRYILLITGQWFCAFNYGKKGRVRLDENDIVPFDIECTNCSNTGGTSIVMGSRMVDFNGFYAKVVLCQRPERRKGKEKFIKDIVDAFNKL